MGIDTRDGLGERPILSSTSNFHKPFLTTDGRRIVFSQRTEGTVWVVNWDGTGLRKVADGCLASDTWRDPETGREWIYALATPVEGDAVTGGPVIRFPLDGPFQREVLWDQSQVSLNNIQVSADGTRFCGQFPWPYAGIANFEKQIAKSLGRGCWTSMCPDNSYRMWVFDGPHRNLLVHEFGPSRPKKINISEVAGQGVYEVYHPRWSNHPRFMVMTGPYKVGNEKIRIFSGGTEVEIYVARFSEDYRAIEASMKVTDNMRADYFPDLWVASVSGADAPGPDSRLTAAEEAAPPQWPVISSGLAYVWENGSKPNLIPGRPPLGAGSAPEARGNAVFGRFFDMRPRDGFFEASSDSLGQIFSGAENGATLEMWITRPAVDEGMENKWVWRFQDSSGAVLLGLRDGPDGLRLEMASPDSAPGFLTLGVIPVSTGGTGEHVMISLGDGGQVTAFVNGAQVLDKTLEQDIPLQGWNAVRWVFGDGSKSVDPQTDGWHGRLEGLAVYNRALSSLEISEQAAAARARTGDRTRLEQFQVDGVLSLKSPIPSPEELVPYRRGLVLHQYALDSASAAKVGAEQVLVAQWAVLDAQQLPDPWKVGERYEMILEPFDEHPELESERMSMGDVALDLPWYYDVTPAFFPQDKQ
jgi:hypothetical protein